MTSWEYFRRQGPPEAHRDLEAFISDPAQADWLEEWALLSALKARLGGREWTASPEELRRREAGALAAARAELSEEIAYQRYLQFLFFRQWDRVKREAHRRGIAVMGALDNSHLPHRHVPNAVVYTGTHDNDTARGWFQGISAEEKGRVLDYLGSDGREIEWGPDPRRLYLGGPSGYRAPAECVASRERGAHEHDRKAGG